MCKWRANGQQVQTIFLTMDFGSGQKRVATPSPKNVCIVSVLGDSRH